MKQAGADLGATLDPTVIRYAMCWEDADVMLAALDVQPGDVCLAIASGGENSLSLLTRAPARVIAVDLSPAQIACVDLKCAAFRGLDHLGLLELMGARPSGRRLELYAGVRDLLAAPTRQYWDSRPALLARGIGNAGRFERYFSLLRRFVLPLVHTRGEMDALFAAKAPAERRRFFDEVWANRRWSWLMRAFLSRAVMGRLGREPAFFRYAEGELARLALERVRHALTDLDPSRNPYLQWIVFGSYRDALPHALRPENFEAIRRNLDRLELRIASVESTLQGLADASVDRFYMSDIFEYLAPAQSDAAFREIARAGRAGGRVAWWNMMVPRTVPEPLRGHLRPLDALARELLARNKAAFYSGFHVEMLS